MQGEHSSGKQGIVEDRAKSARLSGRRYASNGSVAKKGYSEHKTT